MAQRIGIGLVLGLLLAGPAQAALAGVSAASLELEHEHELYRELHKLPPAATLPGPDTVACYERLGRIARFTPIAIRVEPAQCARYDMVRLDGVMMPDQKLVSIAPAPSLRCSMAEAVANWVRDDVGPAAAGLGAPLAAVTDLDSYECRPRNNIPGGKLSEHGTGNALDIGAVKLTNGGQFVLTDPHVSKPFREQMRAAVCTRFMTVLGPGSDSYHNEHIHIDLQERSNDYRICQWDVRDPAVAAIPLPRPRPIDLGSNETPSPDARSHQAKSIEADADKSKPDEPKLRKSKPREIKPRPSRK